MSKKLDPNAKQKILVREVCDTNRLYASLPEAAAYLLEVDKRLSEFSDVSLEEHWTGYEDMKMCISYYRPETDEEVKYRLEKDRRDREFAAQQKQEEAKKRERREAYEALRREFG